MVKFYYIYASSIRKAKQALAERLQVNISEIKTSNKRSTDIRYKDIKTKTCIIKHHPSDRDWET